DDLPSPPDSSRPALRRLERDFQRARDPGHRPGRLSSRIRRGGLSDRAQRARRAGARQCGDLPAAVERRAGFIKNEYFDFADVALKPAPVKPIPIWYGGGTPA